jgi:hypothetical protein
LREGFRGQALGALETLTAVYGEQEAFEAAEAMARRQLALDNLRESAHRQLMAILARNGRRRAALSQFESCRQLLQDERGVAPSAETEALYEAIRGGELDSGKKPGTWELSPAEISELPLFLEEREAAEVESSPVVARERQLAQLGQHLEKALDGHGQVIFITGEAGQGKTTLLNEFGRRALAAGPELVVAGGNCDAYAGIGDPYHSFREVLGLLGGDVESRLAAGVISRDQAERLWRLMPDTAQALAQDGPDLVDLFISGKALVDRLDMSQAVQPAWLRQLNDLVGANAPRSANMEQAYLFKQYARVLGDLAGGRPLVITLDDLQWADTGSISLLFHLGRRLEGSRILIVGAYRPEEVALKQSRSSSPGHAEQHPLAGVVSELKRQHGDIWLDLSDPVTVEGRQFVDTYLETQPNRFGEAFREALFQRTEGHALFTVELLQAMQERGDLHQDEQGRWLVSETIDWTTLPGKVERVIEKRIE